MLHSRDLVHWRAVGAVLARRPRWASERLLGAGARAPGRSRARLLRRAARRAGAAASRSPRGPDRRALPRPRSARVQPHRRDRPAAGERRAGRALARLEAGRQQPRAAHADPRRAARAGRHVAGRAAARAVPRGRALGARATSRHRRCCATTASSTSSTRPGTAAGATAHYATGVARSALAPRPVGEAPRADPRAAAAGSAAPATRGSRAARPASRCSPTTPTCAAIPQPPALLSPLRFDVAGWPRGRRGRAARRTAVAARASSSAPRSAPGWEWPAGRAPPRTRVASGRLLLGRGPLARQTGTTRFSRDRHGHGAAPPAAAPGSPSWLRAERGRDGAARCPGRGLALDDGRRTALGSRRLPPGTAVADRRPRRAARLGRRAREARGRTSRALARRGRAQPLPRWADGATRALTVRGPRAARAQFDSLAIHPR